MTQTQPPTLLQKLRRRRVVLPLVALLLLLGAAALWLRSLFWVPAIDHPFDVQTFGTEQLAEADNAYIDYQAAVSILKPPNVDINDNRELVMTQGWSAASDVLRTHLEANRPPLEAWKTGTAKPDALYQSPRGMTFNTLLYVPQELRELVRLAMLEARRLESEGQPGEALTWYRASLRSSRHAGRRACMIERMIGMGLHAITAQRMVLWAANPDVDASLLRQAREDAVAAYELTEPFSTALKVEYFMQRNTAASISVAQLISQSGVTDPLEIIQAYALEPRYTDHLIRHIYANWLPYVDLPRSERPPLRAQPPFLFDAAPADSTGALAPEEVERFYAKSVFAKRVLSRFENMELAVTRERARQAGLLIVLAAQEYYRAHGRFPESLGDMRDILDPPLDPFAGPTDQFIYRLTDTGAVVYSRADNGQDDGGQLDWEQPGRNLDKMDIGYEIRTPGDAPAPALESQ